MSEVVPLKHEATKVTYREMNGALVDKTNVNDLTSNSYMTAQTRASFRDIPATTLLIVTLSVNSEDYEYCNCSSVLG